jgi:hypothetical protein
MLLFLLACTGKVEFTDTGELPDLGDPYVAIVAAVDPGLLKSSCTIALDLYDAGSGELAASVSVGAGGREWVGTQLEGGVQYTATGRWADCTNVEDRGSGQFEASTFSGNAGDLFLFRYDGVTAAFESLVQREDFEGGAATVTFVDGTMLADAQAVATAAGADDAALLEGTDLWTLRWTDDTPVGEVLTALSASGLYWSGSPLWIREPDWW